MTATLFNTQSHEKSSGFVYRWTYKPTGEYYIGIHKGTTCDGYIGSGKRFKYKWNATSRTDWHRDILHEGDYYKECLLLEEQLVTYDTLEDPLCLNLCKGGGGAVTSQTWAKPKPKANLVGNYRTKPQQVIVKGMLFESRIAAIKHLNISFAELDDILIAQGWIYSCRYNHNNRK